MGCHSGSAGEGFAGRNLGDKDHDGPHRNHWNGSQDLVKMVGLHYGFQVRGDVYALGTQRDQLPAQVVVDHSGSACSDYGHCLLVHFMNDGPGPGSVPVGSVLLELRIDPCFAGMLELS